ncbi:hypothetical protein [Paenirhodobacter sp.]|uniref:hypothetical protein n=1 Tax=Paenirhodobacter sp. TaxID=1965326 RepID=UPI003B508416
MTLLEQIERIEIGPRSNELYRLLCQFSGADEMGVSVLAAAATILSRECMAQTKADVARLQDLIEQFGEVVFQVRENLMAKDEGERRPQLRLIGGFDA